MQYRPFGTTGFNISALGFGAMRLPTTIIGETQVVDEQAAIEMIHYAFESGVNYIDTAYMYCGGQSEYVVGKALKGWRHKVKLSTKLPLGRIQSRDDYRRLLDEQLTKLDTDRIDFYHFHGLGMGSWEKTVMPHELVEEMQRALDEGLIAHASFSFHDQPERMKFFADTGVFSSVLCQYNFLDRSNEEAIAYVADKGLGIVVMGPVGGGKLAAPMEYVRNAVKTEARTPELALRFVLSNAAVSCALSGMNTLDQVKENVATASRMEPLATDEISAIDKALEERKSLAELYCTGCGYCMPCPHGVNIPVCFEAMIHHKVYGFTGRAKQRYKAIGNEHVPGKRADACTHCGACELKCPQNIPIRAQLEEVAAALG